MKAMKRKRRRFSEPRCVCVFGCGGKYLCRSVGCGKEGERVRGGEWLDGAKVCVCRGAWGYGEREERRERWGGG